MDSVGGAVSTPSHDQHHEAGGGAVQLKDMFDSSNDTPYPGDMVDEPVQLEGAGGGAGSKDQAQDQVRALPVFFFIILSYKAYQQ